MTAAALNGLLYYIKLILFKGADSTVQLVALLGICRAYAPVDLSVTGFWSSG